MMTPEILNWLVEAVAPAAERRGVRRVLEIGSLNVNGSARSVLQRPGGEWVGLDQRPGPDVDIVAEAGEWLWAYVQDRSRPKFDMVVACECYEHDPQWWNTHEAAREALRSGGLFVVTTPAIGFPYHPFPIDCYRFTLDAYRTSIFSGRLKALDLREIPGPGIVGLAEKE